MECPKHKTGILCGRCPYRHECPYIKPSSAASGYVPAPEPEEFAAPAENFYMVVENLPTRRYMEVLRVGEDFKLTKPEMLDLAFYIKNFPKPAHRSRWGGGWKQVCAVVAIILLERDRRPIFAKEKKRLIQKYGRGVASLQMLYWAKKEIEKINDRTLPPTWREENEKFI
jgi:hypothetical protein